MSDRQWHAASCLAYACIRLDMAGFSHVSCKSSILSVEEPAHQLREASAEHSGQAGTGREVTKTRNTSQPILCDLLCFFTFLVFCLFFLCVFLPLLSHAFSCSCFIAFLFGSLSLFFSLMVFSVSSLCCCAFCILCYCSFAAFFLLCFPACIFVFPASLFSCSFYIVLSYPCNVCSFSLLCFKFVLQDLFIFLLPCSSPLLQQQQQEQQKQQQKQQQEQQENNKHIKNNQKNQTRTRTKLLAAAVSILFFGFFALVKRP